jgi:hypothetical protein
MTRRSTVARVLSLQRLAAQNKPENPAVSTSSVNCGGFEDPFVSTCSITCV